MHVYSLLPPGYKVTQRGQMYIRNLRKLATKIMGLERQTAESCEHFTSQIKSLCKRMVRDCCIELEDTPEAVETAASELFSNHLDYPENHPSRPGNDVTRKCQEIFSLSGEKAIKAFLVIVPQVIQNVKEIFVDVRMPEVQNGLRGFPKGMLGNFLTEVRNAEQSNRGRQLFSIISEILEELCLSKYDETPAATIKMWGQQLAIFVMLNSLKSSFQHCQHHIKLHKRLELLSYCTRDILSDKVNTTDEYFVRDMSNFALSLIHFAKFSESKLESFESTDSTNSPLTCHSGNVQYNGQLETFSQQFQMMKVSEGKMQRGGKNKQIYDIA